jgi:GNAT superfamily N-acetyltransferase
VYAAELEQYPSNSSHRLEEPPDSENVHIVAMAGEVLAGFISLTPPWAPRYFLERYLDADAAQGLRAGSPFEVRVLTVRAEFRNTPVASLLMYAAMRWVVSRNGATVIAMGRAEIENLYTRLGFRRTGQQIVAGAQRYELMRASVSAGEAAFARAYQRILPKLARIVRWDLDVAFDSHPEHCAHGGRSFDAIGTRFDRLDRRSTIVAADVLDAWFAPAPGVLAVLADDPAWLSRTSPPARADGLIAEIAKARGVDQESVVVGAGSSDLIYRALPRLIGPSSRVLLAEPTYGEYPHLVQKLGARIDVLPLRPETGWHLDLDELRQALARGYDLVILVNPANPTGRHIPADDLWEVLQSAPSRTTMWVDEAYVDYAGVGVGVGGSMEPRVRLAGNVIVCKTMSKAYALSGLRVGYLVAPEPLARELNRWSPPGPWRSPRRSPRSGHCRIRSTTSSVGGAPRRCRRRWRNRCARSAIFTCPSRRPTSCLSGSRGRGWLAP